MPSNSIELPRQVTVFDLNYDIWIQVICLSLSESPSSKAKLLSTLYQTSDRFHGLIFWILSEYADSIFEETNTSLRCAPPSSQAFMTFEETICEFSNFLRYLSSSIHHQFVTRYLAGISKTTLKSVHLSYLNIHDKTLELFLDFPNLQVLQCNNLDEITGTAFRNTKAPLRELNLRCPSLTREALGYIFSLPSIKSLKLELLCDDLTDFIWEDLPYSGLGRNIENLSLEDSEMDKNDTYEIVEHLPSLRNITISSIDLGDRPFLDIVSKEALEERYPNVKIHYSSEKLLFASDGTLCYSIKCYI